MGVFTYRARDLRGELIDGTINSESIMEASRILRAEGKYVLDITPGVIKSMESRVEQIRTAEAARRVSRPDVIEFCHQICVMLEAGVPLGDALEAFNEVGQTTPFRRISRAIQDEVHSGATLSSAMSRWPRVFPPITVTLVKASEASGTMALMLGRVAKYMTKEVKTAKQIRGALAYPCVMILLSLGITAFLVTVVLPRFATIYAKRAAMLPLPTKMMLAMSNYLQHNWIPIVLGVGAVGFATVIFMRTRQGRRMLDWTKLHVPVIGSMYRQLFLTRSARTMATLLVSGVDLLEAVSITRGITNNCYYQLLWKQVEFDLEQGRSLSNAFSQSKLIHPSVVRMISAGEHTGRLGPVMEQIGATAEDELDDAITRVTQFIEPTMIAIMGAVVGFVAIAMLLPIMTISKVIK
ncbi:MAG: type II secretion system F family protein [Phycisphaerales bacterium]|nr:type II secretion system F family protein [Phycisphaerales bacterium]